MCMRSSRMLRASNCNENVATVLGSLSDTVEKSALEALRNTKGGTSVTLATGEDLSLRD
jgi:hypothetical protein